MKEAKSVYLVLIVMIVALTACGKSDDGQSEAANHAAKAVEHVKAAGTKTAAAAGDAIDATGEAAGDAYDAAGEMTDKAMDKAGEMASKAGEATEKAYDATKEKAKDLTEDDSDGSGG